MERVAVYIDGSNLYHKLKNLSIPNTTEFKYGKFCEFLARGRTLISCRYYVGVVRAYSFDKKSEDLRRNQQKLFNNLKRQNFIIKHGYLMRNGDKFHEKGVDVKLATDLLVGAYDDFYDIAIIVSSDTDLIPAIKKVKHLQKQVEYIGFSDQPSFGLQRHATLSRLLLKEEVDSFSTPSLL